MDMDIGHMSPTMPLVVGSMVVVELKGNHVKVQMDYR